MNIVTLFGKKFFWNGKEWSPVMICEGCGQEVYDISGDRLNCFVDRWGEYVTLTCKAKLYHRYEIFEHATHGVNYHKI